MVLPLPSLALGFGQGCLRHSSSLHSDSVYVTLFGLQQLRTVRGKVNAFTLEMEISTKLMDHSRYMSIRAIVFPEDSLNFVEPNRAIVFPEDLLQLLGPVH
ncbi:hypothetical protein Tco_0078106 [Tanacetum coccineum]